jgi:hypothetical protein
VLNQPLENNIKVPGLKKVNPYTLNIQMETGSSLTALREILELIQ